MKHCCVDDPADLCSVNINGQKLTDVKEEDLSLFDSVAYVNASDNLLPFGTAECHYYLNLQIQSFMYSKCLDVFDAFPIIRELEMPVNGLRGLKLKLGQYMNLEVIF